MEENVIDELLKSCILVVYMVRKLRALLKDDAEDVCSFIAARTPIDWMLQGIFLGDMVWL